MEKAAHAIEVRQISKRFEAIQALRDVSFTVPRGKVFCILGPNGAGKTTLLRILTTTSRPDSGTASIEGCDIVSQALNIRQLIGVVAQENHFDRYLSVWHNLTLHAEMHGLQRSEYEPRITELLRKMELYDRRYSLPDDLSGGMKRRIVLIRALIHSPRILFLDEPTTGLDPQGRLEIWNMIEQFKQSATVVLTTHYMEEADRLADNVLILHHGRTVLLGTPRELKQKISPLNSYELVLNTPKARTLQPLLYDALRQGDTIRTTPLVQAEATDDFHIRLQLTDSAQLREIMNRVDPTDIFRLGQVEANLEDVFMAVALSSPEDE